MNSLRKLFRTAPDPTPAAEPVIVVSGLPRSGTSMMMKMLEAGGLPVVVDGIRTADGDNPKGYYEFERVKQLDKGDTAWVAGARGKAVKVISALLKHLPAEHEYCVIFMRRNLNEILASQKKMLDNRSEDQGVSDAEIAGLFEQHLAATLGWVRQQPNFRLLEIDYNDMLLEPIPLVQQVVAFLPVSLDAAAMTAVVDASLYRNRTDGQQGSFAP